MSVRWWAFPLLLVVSTAVAGVILIAFAAVVVYPTLPSLETLTDYRPKVPLRVYSAEGQLIGEFGEERRAVVTISEVPKQMIAAILAAEDERFYQHGGVDYVGVARAALSNFASGGVRQGASTITMQVARNFFLSKEKTLSRKFNEMLLAFKIEHNLTKDQILELYLNQIYLGQRAYGFAAAAQTYFGKPLEKLTLAEHAMLAGLPKAPSRFNPLANPKRAKLRQQYVLRRMREL
jgi:penicillin-binding protein 1A